MKQEKNIMTEVNEEENSEFGRKALAGLVFWSMLFKKSVQPVSSVLT